MLWAIFSTLHRDEDLKSSSEILPIWFWRQIYPFTLHILRNFRNVAWRNIRTLLGTLAVVEDGLVIRYEEIAWEMEVEQGGCVKADYFYLVGNLFQWHGGNERLRRGGDFKFSAR